MNSLRARFAAILVASIALVVVLSTFAVFLATRHLGAEAYADRMARQLDVIARIAQAGTDSANVQALLRASSSEGEVQEELTRRVRSALKQMGRPIEVRIVAARVGHPHLASLEIAPGRWLTVPVDEEPPPPDAWLVIGGWMASILLGTTAIALALAERVTRPLALLETFASGIHPSGEMRAVPEEGPAEVRATARALNRLNQKLRQTIESRMRLVAAAGHDLRTPLTRMRLRAEFLEEGERAKWLANLDELERIADSAIQLVREEVGDGARQIIRLDVMVERIAAELRTLGQSVAIMAPEPVEVMGAPLALTRAIRNLVTNAATHGEGADVVVKEHDGQALLTINDRGPGIPEDLMGRVFEPFFRVDSSRRQPIVGAGLGLAIAHEIIARAGGELILRNRPEGGLTQEVRLRSVSADPGSDPTAF